MFESLKKSLGRRQKEKPAPEASMAKQSAELADIEEKGRTLVQKYLAMELDKLDEALSVEPGDLQVVQTILQEEQGADRKRVIAEFLAQKELFKELVDKYKLRNVTEFNVVAGGDFIAITYFGSLLSGKGVDAHGDRKMYYLPIKSRNPQSKHGAFNGKLFQLQKGLPALVVNPTKVAIPPAYGGISRTSPIGAIFVLPATEDVSKISEVFAKAVTATTQIPPVVTSIRTTEDEK